MKEQVQPEPISLFEVKRRRLLTEKTYYQHKLDEVNGELISLESQAETLAQDQLRIPHTLPPLSVPMVPQRLMPKMGGTDYNSSDPWINGMYGRKL